MQAPRYLTTFEHTVIPVGEISGGISREEADALSALGELRPGLCERGYSWVRLAQYCGIINLGGRLIEVLPKVGFDGSSDRDSRALLLSLLRDAGYISVSAHDAAGQSLTRHTLIEAFVVSFLDRISELAKGGLRSDYLAFSDDLAVVRGRIDIKRQITKLANRPDLIACEFDELTIDNAWNRAVKRALRVVRPWVVESDLRRRWIGAISLFEGVSDVAMSAEQVEALPADRKAVRYSEVLAWVRVILRLFSPSIRAGDHAAPSLLFDMNRVFQACVTRWMRERAVGEPAVAVSGEDTSRWFARRGRESGRRIYNLRPDIVVRRSGAVIAIVDTKWKRLEAEGAESFPALSDAYQLFAYAASFACPSLCLIYPLHDSARSAGLEALYLPPIGSDRPRIAVVLVDLKTKRFFGISSEFEWLWRPAA
jgi:5-methylcytosine-specific restriction enzyme subunit McrC